MIPFGIGRRHVPPPIPRRDPGTGVCQKCGHPVEETPDLGALMHVIIQDGRRYWSPECKHVRGRVPCDCRDPTLEVD